jgi:PKD repeat protein
MIKSIKFFSLMVVVLLNLTACTTEDDTVTKPELDARYTYVLESAQGKVTFINTSENADSYLWDFGDNTTSATQNPVKIYAQTGEYTVTLTAKNTAKGTSKTFSSIVSIFVFEGGLITNGNFGGGISPWTLGTINPIPANLLVTENGNTYFSINVTAAGNPFDVNLSQKGINMVQGKTYRLTFDAWASVNRSMIIGIGLSNDPWTNQSVTQNITTSVQTYTKDLVANFSNTNSRVLFDMGAAVGIVNIDNVKLIELP